MISEVLNYIKNQNYEYVCSEIEKIINRCKNYIEIKEDYLKTLKTVSSFNLVIYFLKAKTFRLCYVVPSDF